MSERSETLSLTDRAMLLTPPGPAAIAVVRLVGPSADRFLAEYFSRPVPAGRAVHGELADDDRLIDDPVVCRISETAVDLSLHGNAVIVQAVLRLAAEAGFAIEPAGDAISLAAVDGESMLDREIAAALPLARTELGWRTLLAQRAAWTTLENATPAEMAREKVRLLADHALKHLLSPPKVALVGLPNAGKSTLANALAGVDRHITADLPGTTRDWVGSIVDLSGLPIELIDTPGVRPTDDPLESRAIELAMPVITAANLVVLVLDAVRANEPAQADLRQKFPTAIAVSNKCDVGEPLVDTIWITATRGEGVEQLGDTIVRAFGCDRLDARRPRIWTARQRALVAGW